MREWEIVGPSSVQGTEHRAAGLVHGGEMERVRCDIMSSRFA